MDNWPLILDFDAPYLISQAFALAATFFSLYAFQHRKKVQILNFTVIAAACSILHYLFLGAWSGVGSKSVSAVRDAIAAYGASKRKTIKFLPFIFVAFYIIVGVFTYTSPVSLLAIAAPSIYTLAVYFGNAKWIRYFAIISSGLWLAYDICVLSIVGIVAEALFIVNDLAAIYRFHHRQAGSKPSPKAAKKTVKKATKPRAKPKAKK